MLPIGLNHMTVPHASTQALLAMAKELGCVGVELRNDLDRPLFEGQTASDIASAVVHAGQRVLGLAEVKAFNQDPQNRIGMIEALIATAAGCGAEGVALIPAVGDEEMDRAAQRAALRTALPILQPLLENYGLKGLIEPLGFLTSTLRFKEDAVAVLVEMQRPDCFALIHDTFHHHLAGGGVLYPDHTAIVHISGVVDMAPSVNEMTDAHRVLVDADDRLDSIGQLRALRAAGYSGPASFEAFAPEIHDMKDPTAALAGSIAFINAQLVETAAGAA